MSIEQIKRYRFTCCGWKRVTLDPETGRAFGAPMVEICCTTAVFDGADKHHASEEAEHAGWTITTNTEFCPGQHHPITG